MPKGTKKHSHGLTKKYTIHKSQSFEHIVGKPASSCDVECFVKVGSSPGNKKFAHVNTFSGVPK